MPKKVLCVCEHGNSRSVALAYLLKRAGHDALAMGVTTASPMTADLLANWADVVILTDSQLLPKLSPFVAGKLKIYDVGDDLYFRGFDKGLLALLQAHLERDPL